MKRVEKALFRCSGSHKGGSRGYCTYALPQRLCHRWWPPPWCALTRNDGLRPFLSSLALHAHRRPPVLWAEHGVLRRSGSVQAMVSRRAHVLQVPLARPVCFGSAREDGDASVEIGARELLRNGRHLHSLRGAHGRLGVEDHYAHLRAHREVARVGRLRGRNPVELRVPRSTRPGSSSQALNKRRTSIEASMVEVAVVAPLRIASRMSSLIPRCSGMSMNRSVNWWL